MPASLTLPVPCAMIQRWFATLAQSRILPLASVSAASERSYSATHSTSAPSAWPRAWRHLVVSPFGWIARPVVVGGAAEDELGRAEDDDDELGAAEDELVGGVGPELSCLMRSAARSA